MDGFLSEFLTNSGCERGLFTEITSITMAGFMSFIARGLDSIPGHLFCYSAISSAAIVGILPGYLIRKSPFLLIKNCSTTFLFSSEFSRTRI